MPTKTTKTISTKTAITATMKRTKNFRANLNSVNNIPETDNTNLLFLKGVRSTKTSTSTITSTISSLSFVSLSTSNPKDYLSQLSEGEFKTTGIIVVTIFLVLPALFIITLSLVTDPYLRWRERRLNQRQVVDVIDPFMNNSTIQSMDYTYLLQSNSRRLRMSKYDD
ncbi:7212_t:CDS:2 [Ambispora leptoticha]|uniref:7212_t:CDS:1 n=1 Tax=Ambispora leptoticha TaxID=144679 RepID=A0A9N9G0M5_9GLOM|nr:7212_t:CDS:2 [Ambispora leptoticha]